MKRLATVVTTLLLFFLALTLTWNPDATTLRVAFAGNAKAKGKGKGKAGGLPPAEIAGEVAAERVTAKQGDYPAIATTQDGATYMACLEWNGQDADRVVVWRKSLKAEWTRLAELDDKGWDHYAPAVAAHGNAVTVVWSNQRDGNFELFAAEVGALGRPLVIQQITDSPQSDFNARLAADSKGNVYVVWQSFRDGDSNVYAIKSRAGMSDPRPSKPVRISPSSANDWEPSVAVDSKGVAWISWDSYHNGNYDVFVRSFDGTKLGDVISVTSEPEAQFHSSVAVDRQDRVWVAWDEAGQNWGKDFSRVSSAPGSEGLHARRKLGVRVIKDGKVFEVDADISKIMTGRMTRFAELPQLAVDGSGTLWCVYRHWTLTAPHEIYHFYATRLTKEGADAGGIRWAKPLRLGNSSGQNSQRATTTIDADGRLVVAYSSDGRGEGVKPPDAVHALPYNVYTATLEKGDGTTTAGLKPAPTTSTSTATATAWTPHKRATMTVGGNTYTLMFGDCHRHTDVRGHSAVDGSAWDTYRYAIDAAQLDFLGLGDHNQVQGGQWPDGLRDYQWWTQQKLADLFTHAPRFFGLYSYEHSLGRPSGHRNVIYLQRGAPMRVANRGIDDDNQPPNLWKWMDENVLTMKGQKVVIVPHTFAEASQPIADWNWKNPNYDCVLEMYQGARSSYEAFQLPENERRGSSQTPEPGHTAQDALGKGLRYGFVSFSDHGSTHNSWAGVWTEKVSREGILDGMLARRTFAGSDEIILKVRADNHPPGQEFAAKTTAPPTIHIDVTAPDTILRVDIVKDGKYVWTTKGDGSKMFSAQWRDSTVAAGKCYYYVRLFQRDTENPDGQPEVAWSSPFFVTYE